MRKIRACLVLIMAFVFMLEAGENLLKNPGFELNSGPRSKQIADWELKAGDVFEVWEQDHHSGKFSIKFWWSGVLYQQMPVSAGSQYEMKAWLSTPDSEPLDKKGTKSAVLELKFISANNEVISTKRSPVFNNQCESGKWLEYEVSGMTPPSAVVVRAVFEFFGGEGGGVVCIDDASLESVSKIESMGSPWSISIEDKWYIKKGDNIDWSSPNFDDSQWDKIEVPGIWEIKYPGYDGFGWYRYHFTVPNEMEKQPLYLLIGIIDDADETYLNGVKIGATGSMPPSFQPAYDKQRLYDIPADIVRYGKDNVIAVRVYDAGGDGGILKRPVRIGNSSGIDFYFKKMDENALGLGKPVPDVDVANAKKQSVPPVRLTIKKLDNGGFTFLLPDKRSFMAVGVDYEPLAMYGEMNWKLIERDLNSMKADGFNTLTVWCMDYNASQGAGVRMSMEEIVKMADLAQKTGLYIQFYLNIDRMVKYFPMALLPDGRSQGFDIDYYNPEYRKFIRNFAKRLAVSLYPYNNVSTIVIWEEKTGLNIGDYSKAKISVETLFASPWGQAAFSKWLEQKNGSIQNLNRKWGTDYPSFAEAVKQTLKDFYEGVAVDDHRQYDVLEFGQIMLADFAKDFVDAYKSVDPTMLFQCRNWDLFGPVRALHPAYSFLDSFGVNQYSFGNNGHDFTLREEIIRMKLIAGITGLPVYVGNFGFRSKAYDQGTHGLVPNEDIKASLAADTVSAFSFLPEMIGTSYFQYYFRGREGSFGIIKDIGGETLPIYDSFKSVHSLMAQCNEKIANSDYADKPSVYIFHGLDAVFDVKQNTWIEHTTMGWDLTDMNVDYKVITDNDDFSPRNRQIIFADFHVYDKKLDSNIVSKLINYCGNGGTLVIANNFGGFDRYLWPNKKMEKDLLELRGLKVSSVKTGDIRVIVKDKKSNIPDISIDHAWYVEDEGKVTDTNIKVLMEIEVNGKRQPGLISKAYGKGRVFYFLFDPHYSKDWWAQEKTSLNRTSLPILHYLLTLMGVKHDTDFGNRGFNLATGRINLHEMPVNHFNFKPITGFGTYNDEYGLDMERYSGGVITDGYISFRGNRIKERGWEISSSKVVSIYACTNGKRLSFFTSDAAFVNIKKDKWIVRQKTEKCRIYNIDLK